MMAGPAGGWTVSPSQLATYIDCPRKWGWEKLEGLRGAQHPSAALGTRVHEVLEAWLTKATPPDLEEVFSVGDKVHYPGRIAQEGLHHLPPPGSVFVESSFHWDIFAGRIDAAWQGAEGPAVLDHKTTSNLGYAKTTEDLKTDPQAIIYASAALAEVAAPHVDMFWIYYKTSKPYRSERVHLRVTREYAAEALRPLRELGQQLLELRRSGARALDLPPEPKSCGRFGGCAFVSKCNLSSAEIMRSMMSLPQSLEEKIAAHKASKMNGHVVPAVPPPIGAPTLPGGLPPVPMAALPVVPALPAVPALLAPPPVPAVVAKVWLPHPTNPAYEYCGQDVRERAGALNPPEAPTVDRAEPAAVQVVAGKTGGDESLAGDELDTMDHAALKTFAKEHGIETKKGLKEKALRIAVREGFLRDGSRPAAVEEVGGAASRAAVDVLEVIERAQEVLDRAPHYEAPDTFKNFVVLVASALLTAREHHDDDLALARRARSIVLAIEKVCEE